MGTYASALEISPSLLAQCVRQPGFNELLKELDIPEEDVANLFDTLDVDGSGTVDLAELVFGLKQLRGDLRRSDIIAVSLAVQRVMSLVANFQCTTMDILEEYNGRLHSLRNSM